MTPTKNSWPVMVLESWGEGLQWGRVDGAVPGTIPLGFTSAMGSRPHFLLGQIPVDTRDVPQLGQERDRIRPCTATPQTTPQISPA